MTRTGAGVVLLIALAGGCSDPQYKTRLPTAPMTLAGKTFVMDVAVTSAAREVGLMYRDWMPKDHGMIFVFDRARDLSFYMKNTRFPLDIVYVDENGKIVSIRQMKALDTTPIPSGAPAKWAIELNEGVAGSLGLKVGDQV